jgi:N-acetylglucosamine-6-phosphate deacetylase
MRAIVSAARLWSPQGMIENPVLEIEDGRIAEITSTKEAWATPSHNFPDGILAPAFFDVHFHGAAGHDVMEATPEALSAIGKLLARHGTATYLATTVTAPLDITLSSVERMATLIQKFDREDKNEPMAHPIGIHLEGPFLSSVKCGVQPREYMIAPDIAIFDRLFEAAQGQIRLMTIAPELPGAVELAAHATARGVRVSLGHSNATAAETRAGIDAGAISATHTFNAMRALDHREPGILGVTLTDDRLYAELICDGIHVDPEMARLFWNTKPEERAILITDAMSATGMPDGEYQLGGFAVQVANGRATVHGALAGSVLTLDRALSNFIAFTRAPIDKALRLLTANPAAMTGLATASLAVDQPANFVVVDASGKLLASFVAGRIAPA